MTKQEQGWCAAHFVANCAVCAADRQKETLTSHEMSCKSCGHLDGHHDRQYGCAEDGCECERFEALPSQNLVSILRIATNPSKASDEDLMHDWTGNNGLFAKAADEIERLETDLAAAREFHAAASQTVGRLTADIERLQGEAEVADEQLAQLRGFAADHQHCDRLRAALKDVMDHGCNECMECAVRIKTLLSGDPPSAQISSPSDLPSAPAPAGLSHETSAKPVAWRHLVDSPYTRHPEWYYTDQAPTEEPERFEALYTRPAVETSGRHPTSDEVVQAFQAAYPPEKPSEHQHTYKSAERHLISGNVIYRCDCGDSKIF